jgi:hypothetical protein
MLILSDSISPVAEREPKFFSDLKLQSGVWLLFVFRRTIIRRTFFFAGDGVPASGAI